MLMSRMKLRLSLVCGSEIVARLFRGEGLLANHKNPPRLKTRATTTTG
jgi:hypothetical protein